MKKRQIRTDEELAELVKKGDTQATAELFERYRIYSWQIGHEKHAINPRNGISAEEYFTCAFESVVIAVQKYSKDKGKALYPYWKTIVNNNIVELVRHQSYLCGAKAFAGISLDDRDEDSLANEERYGFEEPHQTTYGLFEEMFSIIFDPKNCFTPREQQILMCLLDGYTLEEIISVLGIHKSTYNYHLRSGTEKLRAILKARS